MTSLLSQRTRVELPAPTLPMEAKDWALLLDIDGTLVGFQSRPHDVRLSAEMTAVLVRLHMQLGGALAVLSGRTLNEVDRLCAPLLLAAGALHGVQHRDAEGKVRIACAPMAATERVARDCHVAGLLWNGLHVENKDGIAFALHYRDVPGIEEEVRHYASSLARSTDGAFVTQFGDCTAELRPAGPTKGQSLRALMGSPPFANRRPVAVGDDLTDEAAFAEAEALGGFGVIVGRRRPTRARYALDTPEDTFNWLQAISQALFHKEDP